MATVNFLSDNLEEAGKCIDQAVQQQKGNLDSNALVYSLVYLNLRKGDHKAALKILKKRRATFEEGPHLEII